MPGKVENTKQADNAVRKPQAAQPAAQELVPLQEQIPPLTQSVQRAVLDPGRASPADILSLQRLVGNRAVSGLIQAKLTVGPVGDHYEREADRVAEQVMQMGTPANGRMGGQTWPGIQRQVEEEELQAKPLAVSITPLVQRQAEEEEELQTKPLIQRQEEEEEVQAKPLPSTALRTGVQRQEEEEELQAKPLVQRQEEEEEVQAKLLPSPALRTGIQRQEEEEEVQAKPLAPRITPLIQRQEEEEEVQMKPRADGGFEAGPEMESRLAAHKGGGRLLPGDVRAFMEPRFGADFGGVRVHTGGEAVKMNKELKAQAFTHGQDIYLGMGRYDPGTTAGKRLLAHELTHVVQQGKATVRRQSAGTIAHRSTGTIQRAGGRFERLKQFGKRISTGISSAKETVGEKAKAVRGGIASAAKTVGGGIASAAKTVGGGIASAAKTVGGGIASAAKTVGGFVSEKARAIGGFFYGLHLGLRKAKEPVKPPDSLQNIEEGHKYAGELLYAIDDHKHETTRNARFMEQDEIAIQEHAEEAARTIADKMEAKETVTEPKFRMGRLRKTADQQKAKLQKQIDDLTKYKADLQNELPKAAERSERGRLGEEIVAEKQLNASVTYDLAMRALKESRPLSPDLKGRIGLMAQDEATAAGVRNSVVEDVNAIRKSGRSERLFTTGMAKLIGGKIMSVALQTATLTMVGVESKDRPGGYSTTIKVTNVFSKLKGEFQRLKKIVGGNLYGRFSKLYTALKGASTLVVVPLRNLAGSMGLLSTVIGAALGAVTLGAAAGPFVTASTILGYIAAGLTALNALINTGLAIWNGIRLRYLVNQHKRAQLAAETSETASTAVTETLSAGAQGAGIGINYGLTQATLGSEKAVELLKGVRLEDKPLWTTIVKTGVEKGIDIPSQALPSKIAGAVSPGGLGYKEAHETGITSPSYRPHPSHGLTVRGHKVGVPHPKYLTETVPERARWVRGKVSAGAEKTAEMAGELKDWTQKELTAARRWAGQKMTALVDRFSTFAGSVGKKLGKIMSAVGSVADRFAKFKAGLSKSKKGGQNEENAIELADMGQQLAPSMSDWFGKMPETIGDGLKWATEQAQLEDKG